MPSVAFYTLGCKVNFYDTEAIWQLFKKEGYEQVDFEQTADVYLINTCTVTNTGDKKKPADHPPRRSPQSGSDHRGDRLLCANLAGRNYGHSRRGFGHRKPGPRQNPVVRK